jgi:hypothetical protein
MWCPEWKLLGNYFVHESNRVALQRWRGQGWGWKYGKRWWALMMEHGTIFPFFFGFWSHGRGMGGNDYWRACLL